MRHNPTLLSMLLNRHHYLKNTYTGLSNVVKMMAVRTEKLLSSIIDYINTYLKK